MAAGRKTGIFQSWAMCHKQVKQFSLNEGVIVMVTRSGHDRENILAFYKKGLVKCSI